MPHTSRKKKPQGHQKRRELTDSSGWTHILKGPGAQGQQQSASAQFLPSPVPVGLTLTQVRETYHRHQAVWAGSGCFTATKRIFEQEILPSDHVKIDRCVCLGLGSLTGGASIEASMYELAALSSILEILSQTHPIEHVYMQDPIFNRLDEEFLRSDRGYTVLANPEAFAKLTPTAFLFAPHLEWPVYIHALQVVVPALCIGNRVTEYLDHHLPVEQSPQQQQREILAAFRDKTESTEMPDFDRASWCMSTSIYWRRDG